MATFLSSNDYRYNNAVNLLDDIGSNTWYFFVGDHLNHSNATLQPIVEEQYTHINAWENMTMGKAIGSNNAFLMINKNVWTTNTVYAMYDDKDPGLPEEQFFVVEPEGSFWHIWKCLDNNNGANSTISPTFAFSESTPYYESSDGYRWKYLTSIDSANVNNFATNLYFPVVANNTISNAAVNGAIDIIKVQGQGQFYNNYLDGTFAPGDVIGGTIYNISNTIVQKINGYYTGCLLYLTGGTGAGQYTQIIDFQSNSTGNFALTANAFVIVPDNTTQYQIRPSVQVIGNGTETINCIARALVNSFNGNSIYRIEVLQSGQDYLDAQASVVANVYVGVSNTANVRPILPPPGGHGFDVFTELYCNSVGVYVYLSNTEGNTIPSTNIYQQIGLMRNPAFSNVSLSLSQTNGIFQAGETIFSCVYSQLNINCIASSNTLLSCNTGDFQRQFVVGDYVYLTTLNGAGASLNQIQSITNSTVMTFTSNVLFTDASAIMYNVDLTGNAVCTSGGTSTIVVNACPGNWAGGTQLIGIGSGAAAGISSITRNGNTKSFNTFIQLYKYIGSQAGALVPNETVKSGNTTAVLFDVENANTTFNVSNFNNSNAIFGNTGTFIGQTSGGVVTISGVYTPEVIFRSGDIMFLQNIDPVTRSNNQIETFQFILNF
jgi:hypothetical protein